MIRRRIYNVVTDVLTETSERAPQPQNARLELRPHQLALLHRAREFEKGPIALASGTVMDTSIGVIADPAGSGKSFVILSLIMGNDAAQIRTSTNVCGAGRIVFSEQRPHSFCKTTLLVVPHNIFTQWAKYISLFSPHLKSVLVCRTKTIMSLQMEAFVDADLVVTSATCYSAMAARIRGAGLTLRRVVYDEADSINLPACAEINSIFTWFVTASYGNLLYPYGEFTEDSHTGKRMMMATGIRSSGFIRNIFLDMKNDMVCRKIILRNHVDFVQMSINLPVIEYRIVRCRSPAYIGVLVGYVDPSIINMLHAGDVAGAIGCMDPARRTSCDGIVSACIFHYSSTLNTLKRQIPLLEELMSAASDEHSTRWSNESTRVKQKIIELEERIAGIRDRIVNAEACGICLDDLRNQCVLPCCARSYCFECIVKWMQTSSVCPTCKQHIPFSSVMVKPDDEKLSSSPAMHDKLHSLVEIIQKSTENSRILVCSSYENSIDHVAHALKTSSISYSALKGNSAHINAILTSYANHTTKVLLLNSRNYGSGLDLSNTSDIVLFHNIDNELEQQVIGRAQRIGRSSPLRVHYLLHDNEESRSDAVR